MEAITSASEQVRAFVSSSGPLGEPDGGSPSPHPLRWWCYIAAACAALLMLAPLDIPIARLSYEYRPTHLITRSLVIVAEVAAGGIGVLTVLVVAMVVFRIKLSHFPRMVSASLGAGMLADIVKLCVYRVRPRNMDLSTSTFFSTFHGWFPFFSAGSTGQSFPSGHATTAAGLAFTLAMIYPRGRWGFAILALTTSVSRVIVHAHFSTDIAAGMFLGTGWAYACHLGFAAPLFDRLERILEKRSSFHDVVA